LSAFHLFVPQRVDLFKGQEDRLSACWASFVLGGDLELLLHEGHEPGEPGIVDVVVLVLVSQIHEPDLLSLTQPLLAADLVEA